MKKHLIELGTTKTRLQWKRIKKQICETTNPADACILLSLLMNIPKNKTYQQTHFGKKWIPDPTCVYSLNLYLHSAFPASFKFKFPVEKFLRQILESQRIFIFEGADNNQYILLKFQQNYEFRNQIVTVDAGVTISKVSAL